MPIEFQAEVTKTRCGNRYYNPASGTAMVLKSIELDDDHVPKYYNMRVLSDTHQKIQLDPVSFSKLVRVYDYEDTFTALVIRSGRWADSVHPKRTPWNTLVRMTMRELPELYAKPNDGFEVADAIILAADVGYQQGHDVQQFLKTKIQMNEERQWEFREDGMMYHKPTATERS
jgi:hypothetical protein